MKKIIGILLAGALVTSAFAVDFNAKVKMSGDILGGTIDLNGDEVDNNSINALKINNGIVDNNDFITTTFTGDKSGAAFNITLDDRTLKVNSAKVWIQPIDMLKITFGQQAWEQMSETTWTYGRMSAWGHGWFQDGPGDAGFDVSLTPMGGLEFNVGFKPGWDASWLSGDKDVLNVAKTNIGVKVDLNSFAGIPVTVVANWLNAVKKDASKDMYANEFTIGASYGNAYADGLYAHLVARIGFRDGKESWNGELKSLLGDWGNTDKNSMIIDNAVKYSAGAFHAWLSVPVLIDLDKDNDGVDGKNCNTGLGFVVKADYNLGSVTPYVKLSQTALGDQLKDDNGKMVDSGVRGRFADFKFEPTVEVGAEFKVGSCSMGISAKAKIPGEKENLSWSIPFYATMSF